MFDLITVGRVSMDLFSEQLGTPFPGIKSFTTSVGGSPTNIAIGTSRLGLRSAAFTAVGDDKVGDFVIRYLKNEGVETSYIPRKPGKRTGLALLGIQPPDKFPLVFYREDPADIYLDIDDMDRLPLDSCKALLISGTALSRGPCREATLYAAEQAQHYGPTVFHDLDLRPDQWNFPGAYGIWQQRLLALINVVIGTEEEFFSALAPDPESVMKGESLNSSQKTKLARWMQELFHEYDRLEALVLKRGSHGVTIFTRDVSHVNVAGFPVEVVNTVGAGDAFASGLIYSWVQMKNWQECAEFANACGAIVVTRHGCATAMPRLNEVEEFLENVKSTIIKIDRSF